MNPVCLRWTYRWHLKIFGNIHGHLQSQIFGLIFPLLLVGGTHLNAGVVNQVDWPGLLVLHDLVWKRLPERFESAPSVRMERPNGCA